MKLSVTPVRDANGIVTNYIGVQHDITEQRRRIRELRDQTERLELVLSGTETGIGEWDFSTNTVTLDATLREAVGASPTTRVAGELAKPIVDVHERSVGLRWVCNCDT